MISKSMRSVKTVTSPTTKFILKTIGFAGYCGVIVVAPNALQAIDKFVKSSGNKNIPKNYKYYARNSGYIDVKEIDNGKYAITLTYKGEQAAKDLLFEEYQIPKPAKWDGKWRILSFDISEKDRLLRDNLRSAINRLGMKLVQNSVYVYPYDINEFIDNVHKRYPQATQHMIQITATHIDGQEQLIKQFKKEGVL